MIRYLYWVLTIFVFLAILSCHRNIQVYPKEYILKIEFDDKIKALWFKKGFLPEDLP